MTRWFALVVAVIGTAPTPVAAATAGKPAPPFTLRRLDGGRLALRELRGKVVVLSFWALGCPPCEVEAPHLQRLHRKYSARGLRVVGVAPLSGSVSDLRRFRERHGLTYPTLVDPGEKVGKQYGLRTYPLTVLIDREGVVRWACSGFREGSERVLERRVGMALGRK